MRVELFPTTFIRITLKTVLWVIFHPREVCRLLPPRTCLPGMSRRYVNCTWPECDRCMFDRTSYGYCDCASNPDVPIILAEGQPK
jgi:hypothetical protein